MHDILAFLIQNVMNNIWLSIKSDCTLKTSLLFIVYKLMAMNAKIIGLFSYIYIFYQVRKYLFICIYEWCIATVYTKDITYLQAALCSDPISLYVWVLNKKFFRRSINLGREVTALIVGGISFQKDRLLKSGAQWSARRRVRGRIYLPLLRVS